jgi:phenylacetate-CoA ligase
MQKVTGRTDDMMIVRGVNVFPTQIEEQLLRVDGLAPQYLCVLTRPGRLDELLIQVEVKTAGLSDATKQRLGRQLQELVKQSVGISIDTEVVEPAALPRSVGKAQRIDDRRSLSSE